MNRCPMCMEEIYAVNPNQEFGHLEGMPCYEADYLIYKYGVQKAQMIAEEILRMQPKITIPKETNV